jgi:hypothetical protein
VLKKKGGSPSSVESPRVVSKNRSLGIQITAHDEFCRGGDEALIKYNSELSFIDRSTKYLNWRYGRTSLFEYKTLHAQSSRGHDGYLVLMSTRFKGIPATLVVDLAAIDNATANELLNAAIIESGDGGSRIIAFLVGPTNPYAEAFSMNAFFRLPSRFLPRRFPVFTYTLPQGGERSGPGSRDMQWYLTWGDTDVV